MTSYAIIINIHAAVWAKDFDYVNRLGLTLSKSTGNIILCSTIYFQGFCVTVSFTLIYVLYSTVFMQGFYTWEFENLVPKPEPNIFMFDLKAPSAGPQKLVIEGSFLEETPDFTPHGLSHWIDGDGVVYLYVINHRREGDTVECFLYNSESLSLKHRSTIKDESLYNLNDIVVVGLDELYATNDHFFVSPFMKLLETYTRLSWGCVMYYNANRKEAKIAASSLSYPNGIAKSNSGK